MKINNHRLRFELTTLRLESFSFPPLRGANADPRSPACHLAGGYVIIPSDFRWHETPSSSFVLCEAKSGPRRKEFSRRISWSVHAISNESLTTVRQMKWIQDTLRGDSLLRTVIKRKMDGRYTRGRQWQMMLGWMMTVGYGKLKD